MSTHKSPRHSALFETSIRRGVASATAQPSAASPSSGVASEALGPVREATALLHSMLRLGKLTAGGEDDARLTLNLLARAETILHAYAHAAQVEIRPPHLKPADLATVAQETLLLLAGSVKEGTRFDLQQSEALLPMFADSAQIAQTISTLALVVSESAGKQPRVVILTGRENGRDGTGQVFVTVSHDGPVLDQAALDALLSPDSLRPTGSGIGLYIVERIVAAHGGELKIESPRPGHSVGLALTVRLPELVEYQI
jgi:two-component system sensor histidine kinase HydH